MKYRNIIILNILIFIFAGCVNTNVSKISKYGDFIVTEDDEWVLWDEAGKLKKTLDASGFVYEDQQLTEYVNKIAHSLMTEYDKDLVSRINVTILKDAYFNAFCLSDGNIYLNTSLLGNIDNEAQLSMVLAHEISHFIYRHSLKEYRSMINKSAFCTVTSVAILGVTNASVSVNPDSANMASNVGQLIAQVNVAAFKAAMAGYSKAIEIEADTTALNMMIKAGYDPGDSITFMDNMNEAVKDIPKDIPYFYSSHPKIKYRIKNFNKMMEKYNEGDFEGKIRNEKEYLTNIKQLLLDNAQLQMANKYGVKSAKKQLEKYNDHFGGSDTSYYLLGKVYVKEEENKKAILSFMKAIELNKSNAAVYKDLSMLYLKLNDKRSALVGFNKYLELVDDPDDESYIRKYIDECKK